MSQQSQLNVAEDNDDVGPGLQESTSTDRDSEGTIVGWAVTVSGTFNSI